MTLYSFPFSCSFAVELELRRLQLPVEVHNVRRGQARKVADALPNPRRKVPTLVVDGASRTEIVSILHELDCGHVQRPAPQRRAHLEWLSFLATELHQQVIGRSPRVERPFRSRPAGQCHQSWRNVHHQAWHGVHLRTQRCDH